MVNTGCRTITNLQFAEELDNFPEEEQEVGTLVEGLDKTYIRYKRGSAKMTKPMFSRANDTQREIRIKDRTSQELHRSL